LIYVIFDFVKVLPEVAELAVGKAMLDVEGQGQVDEWVLAESLVVLAHVPE
jgi:hypothetical protein